MVRESNAAASLRPEVSFYWTPRPLAPAYCHFTCFELIGCLGPSGSGNTDCESKVQSSPPLVDRLDAPLPEYWSRLTVVNGYQAVFALL
jgi:hypothetical protein